MRVKSYGGHNINDGVNYTAALVGWPTFHATEVSMAFRSSALPLIGNSTHQETRLALVIQNEGGSKATIEALNRQLSEWFTPSNVSKPLVVTDESGANERYIMVRPVLGNVQDYTHRTQHNINLALDGIGDPDGLFRTASYTTDEWAVTSHGQTIVVNNQGEAPAFPVFRITPTTSKTAGFAYKAWIPIRWNVGVGANSLPLFIEMDLDALISASKLQADCADLRFYNDGVEIPRWLKFTDGAWVNLSFEAKQEVTLEFAIADSGDVLVIDVNENIDHFPPSGVLMIDSEAFVYTGKIGHLRRFTGVTRAQRGTSAAAHTAGATAWCVQNDLWVMYGDPTLDEPEYDSATEPMFDYTGSDNELWTYTNFGETDFSANAPRVIHRPGSWKQQYVGYGVDMYNTFRDVPPPSVDWGVVGIHCPPRAPGQFAVPAGRWAISHPCGIVDYNMTDGEKYTTNTQYWNRTDALSAKVQSSLDGATWHDETIIAAPSTNNTWESWTASGPLTYPARHLGLYLGHDPGEGWLDISVIDVEPDPAGLPTITIGDEIENYPLAATITNNTTGESVTLNFDMELDETIELDTGAKTVTYDKDGSSQFQAFGLVGTPRRNWLPLVPGNNELQFDDSNTGNVTIQVAWQMRWYD